MALFYVNLTAPPNLPRLPRRGKFVVARVATNDEDVPFTLVGAIHESPVAPHESATKKARPTGELSP